MLLKVHNLTKKYNNHIVVDNINLNIDKGQLVALLGHNGAGKSTIVDMIAGLKKPNNGQITLNGIDSKDSNYRSQIGMVFQNSILDDELSVKQNLLTRAQMYHNINNTHFNHLMKLFNIQPIMKQKYKILSGGQKRRVDIVRALIHQPKLLILDEPTTGLDLQTRQVIWKALNQYRRQYGMAIILITHYLEEANSADMINIMNKGKIIANGSVERLRQLYAPNILTLFTKHPQFINNNIDSKLVINVSTNKIKLKVSDHQRAITLLNQWNNQIDNFNYRNGDMNDIFVALTGKGIK